MCNPKGCSVFIPVQAENISIKLPTLLIRISLTPAPGSGFRHLPARWSICSPCPGSPAFPSSTPRCRRLLAHGRDVAPLRIHPSLPRGSRARAAERGKYFCGCIRVFLAPAFPVDAGSSCTAGASPAMPCLQPSGPSEPPRLLPPELVRGQTPRNGFPWVRLCRAWGSWRAHPHGGLGVPGFCHCVLC